jgi:hypothetical protein
MVSGSNTASGDEEAISVLVPRRYLAAVHELLAASAPEEGGALPAGGPDHPSEHSSQSAGPAAWTAEELGRLKRAVRNPTTLALLELTAHRAGEWVTFHELQAFTGRPQRQVAAALSGLTALIKRRIGKPDGQWPVEVDWAGRPRSRLTRYRMPPPIARWWQAS